MREKRAKVVVFEHVDLTQEQFDLPIFWVLAALLAFMPMAFGSWGPWQEAIALAGAEALALMLGIKLLRRTDVPFSWSWTYLPIVLFFLLAFFQMVPLPSSLLAAISPRTVTTHQTLLGDLPGAAKKLSQIRLNFYPEGGWHNLRNLVAVTCVFVVVVNVFRRPDRMIQLLWVIAWVGFVQAVIAILQILTDANAVYWYFDTWGNGLADSGSFPNHNCYSQFMNLSTGAMVALLLHRIDQTFHRRDYTSVEIMEKLGSSGFRAAWILLVMIAVAVASVFLSLSRSGMLAIVVAGIVVGVLLAFRGGSRGMGIGGWFAGVMLMLAFSLVMASGSKLVESRIALIGNPHDRYDRLQLTKDTLRAWRDYPAVGTGLGAFRYTFPAYDRSNVPVNASHAEDEYAQLLEETGVAGAAIAGSFLLMMLGNFLRARARGRKHRESEGEDEGDGPAQDSSGAAQMLAGTSEPGNGVAGEFAEPAVSGHHSGSHHSKGSRRRRSNTIASPASSLSLGLCFGLVAIFVQSAADFGQHCVSIACLTSIFFALLINLARFRRQERGLIKCESTTRGSLAPRAIALVAIIPAFAFLLWQAEQVREAAEAYDHSFQVADDLQAKDWKWVPGELEDMVLAADKSARIRPGDIQFRFWRAMHQIDAINAQAPIDPATQNPSFNDEQMAIVRRVVADLQDAAWICPTYGPLYTQEGQLQRNYLGELDAGARNIRVAYTLAPGDANTCFVLAELDADEGKWSDSVLHFQRAAMLTESMFKDAVGIYVSYYHHPQSAVDLAGDDVSRLRFVAGYLRSFGKDAAAGPTTGPATQPADEATAVDADRRAEKALVASADSPNASAKTLGEMGLLCANRHEYLKAVNYLDRALTIEYGQEDWRLAKVQCLIKLGRKDDAIHEARIMLRFQPGNVDARAIIDQLTAPATTSNELQF